MSSPMFSVITPTYNRCDGKIQRCVRSIWTQQFKDYEYIIVDDGSTDRTEKWADWTIDEECDNFYLRIPHSGRVIARNRGIEAAQGEWICWLDSDDAFDPMYLATFAHNIKRHPEAKLWVCGAVVHGMVKEDDKHIVPKYTTLRPAWMPPVDEHGVHTHFPSGTVGTGMFVFHRDCLDAIGAMPDWKNHDEIAEGSNKWLGYETGYKRGGPWCGNPFGDDWIFFRKLTQFYHVNLIDACLYVQYRR